MNARGTRLRATAGLLAAVALVATGCGQQADAEAQPKPAAATVGPSAAPTTAATPTVDVAPAAASAAAPPARPEAKRRIPVEDMPTALPPGDPGLDAAGVPDPGVPEHDEEHHHEHEHPARTRIPLEAMLDPRTVDAVLAGDWTAAEAAPLRCLSGVAAVGTHTLGFAAGREQVVQTLATHESHAEADHAVADSVAALRDCGWARAGDPRMGTASAALRSESGAQSVVLVSAEGVTVALAGTSGATAHPGRWSALLDMALGNSCAAAPEGCH